MCCCVCSSIIIFLGTLFVIFFNVGMRQGDPLVGLLFVLAHFHILCYFVGVFPLCLFITLALPMLFPLFLWFPIGLCRVVYSTPQVSTWASFVLLLGFVPCIEFCCPVWYQDPWRAFWFCSFAFSFLEEALNEDVQHVNMFLKLGDI